jgi:hypothetical protein
MGVADQLAQLKAEKSAANLKAGQDFLATNKQRAEVTELPSGLQYEVLTEGTGAKPQAHNEITCHYHGTLIDGTVFDSSVQRADLPPSHSTWSSKAGQKDYNSCPPAASGVSSSHPILLMEIVRSALRSDRIVR